MPGIRTAQTHDPYSAEVAAQSNDSQIIIMGSPFIGNELAQAIVEMFLASDLDPKGSPTAIVEAINRLDTNRDRRMYRPTLHLTD